VELDTGGLLPDIVVDDSDSEPLDPAARGGQVVDLRDHHVSAVAATAVEVPPRRSLLPDRRYHLEQAVPDPVPEQALRFAL
jgi:hypothetical protein